MQHEINVTHGDVTKYAYQLINNHRRGRGKTFGLEDVNKRGGFFNVIFGTVPLRGRGRWRIR
jgi:hypothetical protein